MCFERTKKKVKPFNVGYRLVFRHDNQYHGCCSLHSTAVSMNEWVDEMPFRFIDLLLDMETTANVGWHVFSSIKQAKESVFTYDAIVRVECYGLEPPYGLGVIDGKPAGRFQFMKILEEVA